MEQSYLIDSNVVIDYLAGRLPDSGMSLVDQLVDETPQISVITKIEILGFNTTPEADRLLAGFINASTVLLLDERVSEHTITLRKKYRIKIPDAIIAATALVHDSILLTHNTDDFKKIENLKYIDPHGQ